MGMIIKLLKRQNAYLNQFSQLSQCQFQRIQKGDLSRINHFYRNRQVLLNKIESIDQDIKQNEHNSVDKKEKKEILELLNEKRKIGHSILQNDLCIHRFLKEREQNLIKDQSA